MASGQKSRNRIGPLVNESGEVIRDNKEVEEEVISFFSNLYGLEVFPKPFVQGVDWSPFFREKGMA